MNWASRNGFDKVDSVNELDSRKQLIDDVYGELTDIANYENKINLGASTMPGGSGKSKFSFDDGENGFEIKKKSKEFIQTLIFYNPFFLLIFFIRCKCPQHRINCRNFCNKRIVWRRNYNYIIIFWMKIVN